MSLVGLADFVQSTDIARVITFTWVVLQFCVYIYICKSADYFVEVSALCFLDSLFLELEQSNE